MKTDEHNLATPTHFPPFTHAYLILHYLLRMSCASRNNQTQTSTYAGLYVCTAKYGSPFTASGTVLLRRRPLPIIAVSDLVPRNTSTFDLVLDRSMRSATNHLCSVEYCTGLCNQICCLDFKIFSFQCALRHIPLGQR